MKQIVINKYGTYFSTLLLASAIGLTACNHFEDVPAPKLEISVDKYTFEIGDSVQFNLLGNPDIISFYSGESGNDYEFVNKDRINESSAELSFQTQVRSQTGPNSYCQEDQFSIHVSKDFKFDRNSGQDSVSAVRQATWQDITSLFVLCPLECSSGTAYKFSELIDVSDLFEEGKPLYFAFRYKNKPYSDYGNGNIWRFSGFLLNGITESGSSAIATQRTANWMPVFIGEGWDPSRFSSTTTVAMMRGPSTNEVEQELWTISEGVYYGDINLGQDKALGLKGAMDIPLTTYKHPYSKPGLYTATFVGRNSNIYDQKETIKQIQITIVDSQPITE